MGLHRSGIKLLKIADIRRNGGTQNRLKLQNEVVAEYSSLIRGGVNFPPIRVCFDGTLYWLTDGFHRLAAAELAGIKDFSAEIFQGTIGDAVWDSLSANTAHGLRRSREECQMLVRRALEHPKSSTLSNVQIAKHLGLPEATFRRWRKDLQCSNDSPMRSVERRGRTYTMAVEKIGQSPLSHTRSSAGKSTAQMKEELRRMKRDASPDTARLLNVIEKWLFAGFPPEQCTKTLEAAVQSIAFNRMAEPNGAHWD